MQNIKNNVAVRPHIQFTGKFFLLALALTLVSTVQIRAVGFRLPNQDPEAIARGDAFAATADNPSAIYYNPSGITQMPGMNLRVGVYAISANTEFKSSSTGGTARSDTDLQAVPQLYFVDTLTNLPLSFGVGLYAPYGLSLDYGKHPPFDTVAQSGSLVYLSLNPVVAYKVTKTLSIGVGPTINYSQASFNRAIVPDSHTEFNYTGHAVGYGFNAGVMWQPHPMWSIGVNYRSPTTLNYDGRITTSPSPPFPHPASSSASIEFPQFVVGGVSFRPTTNWNLEVDVDWTEWHEDRQIAFHDAALGNPALTLNYHNSFIYDFGITRQLGQGYFASVGYIYAESSSPDAHYTPLIPDSDLSLGSVGFGHHGVHWDWAIAYHFAFNALRSVENDSNASADGAYRTFNNAFNISGTYKF